MCYNSNASKEKFIGENIKVKKKIICSISLILIGILIISINKIIGNFDWHLRSEYIWIALLIIPLGTFLLGLFLLQLIRKEEFYDYDDYEHPEYRKYYKIPKNDSIIYYYNVIYKK